MWDAQPDVWRSYAPVLFPIIGALKNKQTTIHGKAFAIPKHGFIRYNNDLVVKQLNDNTITFELSRMTNVRSIYF